MKGLQLTFYSSLAARAVVLLKRSLLENAQRFEQGVQRNNEVNTMLKLLARQLAEITSIRDAQQQLLTLIEGLNQAVVTSEQRLMKTITTTTVTETHNETGNGRTVPPQISHSDQAGAHAPTSTSTSTTISTESVSKLKLEFSRFQRKGGCVSERECTCHRRRRYRSPSSAQKFLGEALMGFTGLPLFASPCSDSRCVERSPFSATMTYYLPTLLLNRMVSLIFITTSQGDPAACIKIRPLNSDFSIYRAVENNDLEGVRNVITCRTAHPSAAFNG
jgi:hypothetical protein